MQVGSDAYWNEKSNENLLGHLILLGRAIIKSIRVRHHTNIVWDAFKYEIIGPALIVIEVM